MEKRTKMKVSNQTKERRINMKSKGVAMLDAVAAYRLLSSRKTRKKQNRWKIKKSSKVLSFEVFRAFIIVTITSQEGFFINHLTRACIARFPLFGTHQMQLKKVNEKKTYHHAHTFLGYLSKHSTKRKIMMRFDCALLRRCEAVSIGVAFKFSFSCLPTILSTLMDTRKGK